MNAPFSRYLTRFPSDATAMAAMPETTDAASQVTLGLTELEARLDAARREVRSAAEQQRELEITALVATHEAALAEALGAARAEWCHAEGGSAASLIDAAVLQLRESLAERIAAVLRPLLAEAIVERSTAALGDALDRILADPAHPCLTLRAPGDLIAAIRAKRLSHDGVTFLVADAVEAVVTGDGVLIETRLGAALAALAPTEP